MYLVMINGPCGVGKSETSNALQESVSNSEWIRLDDIRKTIPEEQFMADEGQDAVARMWHANVLGRKLAETALTEGRTCIVDAIKYQTDWVEPWESLGKRYGAKVLDICLTAPKSVVEERALHRGYKPGGRLTPEKVSLLYDKVEQFYVERPDAVVIDTENLTVGDTVEVIKSYMSKREVADGSSNE